MIAALESDIIMLLPSVVPGETEKIQEEEEARPRQHDLHQRREGAEQHPRQTGERHTHTHTNTWRTAQKVNTSKIKFKSKINNQMYSNVQINNK